MDLRSLWTAPFPSNPALATSNLQSLESGQPHMRMADDSCEVKAQDGSISDGKIPLSRESSSFENSVTKLRRKPIPRKGHTKSRKGCYSCKRRKIKCPETKPQCENCLKAGVPCEYPASLDNRLVLASAPAAPLASSPTRFTMDDMRFFHYFIIKGYPHLPIGSDHTWTMEIPAIAHQYDYLMRAILGLGASHLNITTKEDLHSQALAHRIDAIKLLNKALSRAAESREEVDARFATFMVLTFQSACMPEGLNDFLTMLRGCILNGPLGEESYFRAFSERRYLEVMDKRFTETQLESLDTKAFGEALVSLGNIMAMCETDTEKEYHAILTEVAVKGFTSPRGAYQAFLKLYNYLGTISHGDFQRLLDTRNPTSLLLLSHYLAAHVLLRHISAFELHEPRAGLIDEILKGWMARIDCSLPPEYRAYNKWPLFFVKHWAPFTLSRKAITMST